MSGRRTKVLREAYRALPRKLRGRNLRVDDQGTVYGNNWSKFKRATLRTLRATARWRSLVAS